MNKHIWVIYFDCTKDNQGWIRLLHTKTRKKARQYVKISKLEDFEEQYPFFKYRIVKEIL